MSDLFWIQIPTTIALLCLIREVITLDRRVRELER